MNYPSKTPKCHSVTHIFPTLLWCTSILEELINLTWVGSPFLGTRYPGIIFTIGHLFLSNLRLWNSPQEKKNVINYCMPFLPVISSSPGGSYISITGEPICNLSGSAYTTISSWMLRSITKPALIHAQGIWG